MNSLENEKKVSPLAVRLHAIEAVVLALILVSAVMSYVAGYYIADFFIPEEESEEPYGGNDSRSSFSNESGYGNLINLRSLGVNYGGAGYINRIGHVTENSYAGADAASRAFISGDGGVKNYGVPAETYGDAGGVSRAALFNYGNNGDFNIPESSTPGWSQSTNGAGANGGGNAGSGGGRFIVFPPPDTGIDTGIGSGTGTGTGSGPAPTPIPAALPLFGSGLALLWILYRASKS
jgi:hypothetical protein